MKLIIAGSRNFINYTSLVVEVDNLLKEHPEIDTIISGDAMGADRLGARYALENGLYLISMPADWNKFGKSAGYKKNEEMAKTAQACICFWDGQSKGTKHMIDLAKKYNLILKVVKYK